MSKTKKGLIITALALDVAITIFFFVISIIMIAKAPEYAAANPAQRMTWAQDHPDLIGFLQANNMVYLFGFVIPLFVLLAANVAGLVIYIKKTGNNKKLEVADLTDEQKEALKKELLKDLEDK